MFDPYAVLGISANATKEQAKQAYRGLVGKLHPDHGGDEAHFKEVQKAWELIKKGYVQPKPQPKSTWSWKARPFAKPTPAFEARGTPNMPRTFQQTVGIGRYAVPEVVLEITQQQAFEGCVVPFIHNNKILEHEVRPGSSSSIGVELFPSNNMIGAPGPMIQIQVKVQVTDKPKARTPEPKGAHMDLRMPVCALGLFTGGKLEVRDYLNELVEITVPAGFNPSEQIVIPGKGYGVQGHRGDLRVTIDPVYRKPNELNSNELRQLQRLNEMAKV